MPEMPDYNREGRRLQPYDLSQPVVQSTSSLFLKHFLFLGPRLEISSCELVDVYRSLKSHPSFSLNWFIMILCTFETLIMATLYNGGRVSRKDSSSYCIWGHSVLYLSRLDCRPAFEHLCKAIFKCSFLFIFDL